MPRTLLPVALVALVAFTAGCPKDDTKGSIACFVATQYRCKEYPQATPEQLAYLPDDCANTHGELRNPGKCPSERFTAKCTIGAGPGREVRRFYTGVNLQDEKDLCENSAHGVFAREW